MLRIEVKRLVFGGTSWTSDIYSGNNKRMLLGTVTKRKSSTMKTVNNFIATTGMAIVSRTKHKDGTVTIIVKNTWKVVHPHFIFSN